MCVHFFRWAILVEPVKELHLSVFQDSRRTKGSPSDLLPGTSSTGVVPANRGLDLLTFPKRNYLSTSNILNCVWRVGGKQIWGSVGGGREEEKQLSCLAAAEVLRDNERPSSPPES